METEKNNVLKPTYKRPRSTERPMQTEISSSSEAISERQEYEAMRVSNNEAIKGLTEKQGATVLPVRTTEVKQRQSTSAQSIKDYENYRDALAAYEDNLRKEAQDMEKRDKIKEIKSQYVKQWDEAEKNAKEQWLNSCNDEFARAEKERDKLRTLAEQEKLVRILAVDEKRKSIQEKQHSVMEQEEQLQKLNKQLEEQLVDAQNYTIQGYDCDSSVQRSMQEAAARNYISKKQANMVSQSVEQFCAKWVPGLNQLKQMETDFLNTSFKKRISHFEVDEDAYKKILFRFKVVLFAVFFVFSFAAHITKWDFFLLLVSKLWMVSITGFFYLVASAFAKIVKRHKHLKVRDSFSGIIAWAIAMLIANQMDDLPWWGIKSIPFCIEVSAVASMTIGAFCNLFLIRKFVIKIPFIVTLAYRDAFRAADSEEEQEHSLIQKDLISAMICCYINHDAILLYLSTSAREQEIHKLKQQIQETESALRETIRVKQELDKQDKAFQQEKNMIKKQNQETDIRLKRQLEEVDRRYGTSSMPDFSKREYLLPNNIRKLEKLEKELEKNGFSNYHIDSKNLALKDCENFLQKIEMRLGTVQAEIDKNVGSIRQWMYGSQFPPDKDKDGKYRYCLDQKICMSNIVDIDDKRPIIIEHNGMPMIFRCTDNWNMERGAALIYEIWNSFAKIVPENIMRIFVVEIVKSVSAALMSLNFSFTDDDKGNLRKSFRRAYKEDYVSSDKEKEEEQSGNEPELRVLYHGETEMLLKDLKKHQNDIRDYITKNEEEADDAEKQIRRSPIYSWQSSADIARENYCERSHGDGKNLKKYQVVIFVVPEKYNMNSSNTSSNTSGSSITGLIMETFWSMIEAKNGKNYGILPILLMPKHSEIEEWERFAKLIEEQSGTVYHVSMENLRLQKAQQGGQ